MSLTALITSVSSASNELRCNARDLHTFLQVGRHFNAWINGRIETYGFEEGEDFFVVTAHRERFDYPDRGNQTFEGSSQVSLQHGEIKDPPRNRGGDRRSTDYLLTLDMAKELAMIENSDIGRQVRRYFIEREKQLIALLEERAARILPLPGVTRSARDGINLKQVVILQEQSAAISKRFDAATGSCERQSLHLQLRQVHDALGLPTPPLEPSPQVIHQTEVSRTS